MNSGNEQDLDKIIGQGWSFPPAFDIRSKTVETVGGIEDIEQSIRIISTTLLGERVMRPDFGCGVRDRLFKGMSTTEQTLIKEMIKTALLYYEPRIEAEQIDLRFDAFTGMLEIMVTYSVRNTNSRYNYVFPLYLEESTARKPS